MSRRRYAYADGATVKARKQGNPKQGYVSWALTVPSTIARDIPDLEHLEFVPEITTEGILYRPVAIVRAEVPVDWHREASNQDRDPALSHGFVWDSDGRRVDLDPATESEER